LIDRALTLDLNLNLTSACFPRRVLESLRSDPDQAVELFPHAMRFSPLDPEMFRMQAGDGSGVFVRGRFEGVSSWAE
jgi:hypothetical protein